jgi:hypothetical protein
LSSSYFFNDGLVLDLPGYVLKQEYFGKEAVMLNDEDYAEMIREVHAE